MPSTKFEAGPGPANATLDRADAKKPVYQLKFVKSPFVLTSLWELFRERRREPKITVPQEYYRGEAKLPLSDSASLPVSLRNQIKSLFEKPQPAAIPITSQPAETPDLWQDYKPQKISWLNSILANALVVALIILPSLILGHHPAPQHTQVIPVDISPYLLHLPPAPKRAGGGGGGGTRTPTPPSKGREPKFSWTQLAPPSVTVNIPKPKLPVEPTILGPPDMKLPKLADNMLGNPTAVPGPPSNGPGTGGGIGDGNGTGVGSGSGGGLGPGQGGGTGGGVFSVGGGVSQPVPIYDPDPPYSEQARKAKYQGTVVLSIVVDAQGGVHDARVVKPLGLGLDEEAVKTIQTWKFKPAERNGTPVPVRILVEVTFRLF
ncbi:MAG TPA: energy transducer TonB [Terriglobia bacterium]|nr:energy transducer TonB [Terriglobia bacterium]